MSKVIFIVVKIKQYFELSTNFYKKKCNFLVKNIFFAFLGGICDNYAYYI